MSTAVKPIPEGLHTVTPYLFVSDAVKAIEFYKKAFGAEELFRMPGPRDKIMHARIKIGDSIIMLCDETPEVGVLGPVSRGGATSSHMLYTTDVDATFDRAVKAGCTVKMPLSNQFWGDRYANVIDPFGHHWGLATHVEDVAPEEMVKRMQTACKENEALLKK